MFTASQSWHTTQCKMKQKTRQLIVVAFVSNFINSDHSLIMNARVNACTIVLTFYSYSALALCRHRVTNVPVKNIANNLSPVFIFSWIDFTSLKSSSWAMSKEHIRIDCSVYAVVALYDLAPVTLFHGFGQLNLIQLINSEWFTPVHVSQLQ